MGFGVGVGGGEESEVGVLCIAGMVGSEGPGCEAGCAMEISIWDGGLRCRVMMARLEMQRISLWTTGLIYSLEKHCLRYFALIVTFLLASRLHGQETCSEEVKLLLSPAQVKAAIPALQGRERHMAVFIFMTRLRSICCRLAWCFV